MVKTNNTTESNNIFPKQRNARTLGIKAARAKIFIFNSCRGAYHSEKSRTPL